VPNAALTATRARHLAIAIDLNASIARDVILSR